MNETCSIYLSFKLTQLANQLGQDNDPIRRAFSAKLHQVIKVLYAIELVNAKEWEKEQEDSAIAEFFDDSNQTEVLGGLLNEVNLMVANLSLLIERVKHV